MPYYKILCILSFFYAVFLIGKNQKSTIPYLYAFVIWVFISELIISPLWKYAYNFNSTFYSIYSFTCVSYYGYIIYIKNPRIISNKHFLFSLILLILAYCNELYFKYEINLVTNYSYLLGLSFVVMLIIHNFSSYLNQEFKHFFSDEIPLFIFSIGIIVFYFTSFPLLFFFDYLVQHNQAHKAYDTLLKIGNFILHLGYLLTLIWLPKTPPSTTSS
jgi:hypothetical protein